MKNAIEVRGLRKHYGETRALDGVDLDVPTGTVLGVLGPNGAGKTTLVRILATLVKPTSGSARVAGIDVLAEPKRLRRVIGLTGQYASVDEALPGRENLYLIGRLLDLPKKQAKARADELLERFSLTEAARRPVTEYSGGMRRRLDLAASMIGRPRVLYLDEPTTGLDPRTRAEVWEETQAMVRDGATVLLTTQYMEEAEQLADAVTVVDRGKVIAGGEIAELKRRVGGQTLRVTAADPADLPKLAEVLAATGLTGAVTDTEARQVSVPLAAEEQLNLAIGALGSHGVRLAGIETVLPSLDEVFLAVTGRRVTEPVTEPGAEPAIDGTRQKELV